MASCPARRPRVLLSTIALALELPMLALMVADTLTGLVLLFSS